MLRFLSLVLAFVLGFAACVGTIFAAGAYAYTCVSYQTLVTWGVAPEVSEEVISKHAPVRVTDLTVKGLVEEVQKLSAMGETLTIQTLIDRYGLTLPETVDGYIAESWRSVPLTTLFSAEGVTYLLDHTDVEYIYSFLPEGVLSEPAKEALAKKTFGQVIALDLGGMLENVKLGYLLGLTYEKIGEGAYELVYADAAAPTLLELVAPLSLGNVLTKITEGGDVLGAVAEDLGTVLLSSLTGDALEAPLSGLLEGKTLGDLLTYDEGSAKTAFDVGALTENLMIGTILGYTAVKDDLTDPDKITGWLDGESALTGITLAVANISIDRLINDETFDILDAFSDLYIGDLMEYLKDDSDPEAIVWCEKTRDGLGQLVPLTGINKAVAGISLDQLLNDPTYDITDAFSDLYIGDLMEYLKDDSDPEAIVWCEKTRDGLGQLVPLTGINKAIAGISLDQLLNEPTYDITDAFSDLYLGEVMGYTKGEQTAPAVAEETDLGGNVVVAGSPAKYAWWDKTNKVSGVQETFSNYLLGDIINGKVSISADDMTIASVLGLYSKELPAYTVGDVRLQDEHGNDLAVKLWYTDEACTSAAANVMGAIADTKIGDLSTAMGDIYIGTVIGYEKGYLGGVSGWYSVASNGDKATLSEADGIMVSLADLSIDDLNDSGAVTDCIQDVKIATALGYKQGADGYWYTDPTNPATKVTGIMASIADFQIKTLESDVNGVQVGAIMGYSYDSVSEKWYTDPADSSTEMSGIMTAFADLTVGEFSDGSKVSDAVNEVQMGTALGYTQEGGVWKNGATPVSGLMKILAPKKIKELDSAIDSIAIGEIMGYQKHTDDKWYTDPADPSTVMTGLMSAFADLTVNDMTNEATVQNKIQSVKVGEAMGYTYEAGVWKDGGTPVTGIMKVLADSCISDLSDDINESKLGDVLAYTYNETELWWYDETEKTSPLINKLSSAKLSEVGETLGDLTLADVFTSDELSSGFLSLLDPSTKLYGAGGMASAVTDAFQSAAMGDLIEYKHQAKNIQGANILSLDSSTQATMTYLDMSKGKIGTLYNKDGTAATESEYAAAEDQTAFYDHYWKTLNISEFISYVTDAIPTP